MQISSSPGRRRSNWLASGRTELYAIVARGDDGRAAIKQAFSWHETGRLLVTEKAQFLSRATTEIIEIGTGLTTFASYFDQTNPELFKTPVYAAIERGVEVRCYALDPDSDVAQTYLADRGEPEYADRIRDALERLARVRDEVAAQNWPGSFEVNVYAHIPSLYALAVDLDETDKAELMASPYLFGVARAETPVMRFSFASNRTLLERYRIAIRAITASARSI